MQFAFNTSRVDLLTVTSKKQRIWYLSWSIGITIPFFCCCTTGFFFYILGHSTMNHE